MYIYFLGCKGYNRKIVKKNIIFPMSRRDFDTRQLFANRSFPNCVGAIDGTYIPILAPLINKSDFYNRK